MVYTLLRNLMVLTRGGGGLHGLHTAEKLNGFNTRGGLYGLNTAEKLERNLMV